MSDVAIHTFLRPLLPFLNQNGVTEISINKPGEAWIECKGEMECHAVPELDFVHIRTLANLIAKYSEQQISEETPLLSATLPGGYRVQIVLPPAVEQGSVAISIRKQFLLDVDLENYERLKAFESTNQRSIQDQEEESQLSMFFRTGHYRAFIEAAMLAKKNILISAGTSTGKTTFLNACLKAIPQNERILTIEDAREVKVPHQNRVHLLSSRGGQGLAKVTPQQLLEASLRLRPDRIILGELRGAEAFSYLRAINSGHPGSITTIHADSPTLAFEQLALMVMQADLGMERPQILEYIKSIIPIVVQLKRGEKGHRYVSEIYYREAVET